MNPGKIWWNQIGNSLRLLTCITDTLEVGRSAILQVPPRLPWRYEFYDTIQSRCASFSGERRLVQEEWTEDADPGAFVLEQLCSSPVQAEYWPGQTYANYLAARKDILLNDYDVWVTGVHTKEDELP